jgi:transcriptional regulator with XRE-family HTH domain
MSGAVPVDGAQLKRLCLRRVIGRRQLAEQTGLGYSTLSNIEGGFKTRVRPETVQRIAAVLRVKPESLVDVKKL